MATQSKQSLRDKHAGSWIAENEGDMITGTLQEMVPVWSDQRGGNYPLLKLTGVTATGYDREGVPNDDRELAVHCFGAVLYNEVKRQRPMTGEQITITYRGESTRATKPGQNPAKLYTMLVEGLNRGDAAKRAYDDLFGGPDTADRIAAVGDGDPAGTGADEDIPF